MAYEKTIKLKDLRKLIDFEGREKGIGKDIAILQEQGAGSLYNILCEKNYTYLADEVGMGKTYQSLATASLVQYYMEKSVRILVVAPKKDIQEKWMADYDRFCSENLKKDFYTKKSPLKSIFCNNLKEFIENNNENNAIFFLRLSSFSSIIKSTMNNNELSLKEVREKLVDTFNKIGVSNNKFIKCAKRKLTKEEAVYYIGLNYNKLIKKFDLMIIDEAQNVRNVNFATMALNTVLGLKRKNMFDDATKELSDKVPSKKVDKIIYASATPAHRSFEDIKSVISFADTDINDLDLKEFMIRRLRRYGELSKYEVRENYTEDTNETIDNEQELFIALIQKKLEKRIVDSNENKNNSNNNIYKIGFLETFESFEPSNNNVKNEDDDGENKIGDFPETDEKNKTAVDKQILIEMSKSFKENVKRKEYPPHPKQDYINKMAEASFNEESFDKQIVFVRRLASVRELCKRASKVYDNITVEKWAKIYKEPFNKQRNSIGAFLKFIGKRLSKDNDTDDETEVMTNENGEVDDDLFSKSEVMKYFTAKKENKTSGDKFRNSFNKNRNRAYMLEENYILLIASSRLIEKFKGIEDIIKYLINEKIIEIVNTEINKNPLKFMTKNNKFNESEMFLLVNNVALGLLARKYGKLRRLYEFHSKYYELNVNLGYDNKLAHFYANENSIKKYLRRNSIWNEFVNIEKYSEFILDAKFEEDDLKKRELIKTWLGKEIRMSDGILALVYICTKPNRGKNALCKEFILYLKKDKKLDSRVYALINNYTVMKKNLIATKEYGELTYYNYNAKALNNQYPVVGVVGGSKSNKITIQKFNTPFFPDIIICTDVLKEGVDLHLFCKKVCHFGLAWTPGDLEQRTGRVDRYQSLVHRDILNNKEAKILSYYPYMGNTIDEQQIIKVLRNKRYIDPIIDEGKNVENSNEIDSSNIYKEEDINKLLEYKPENIKDPYPANFIK